MTVSYTFQGSKIDKNRNPLDDVWLICQKTSKENATAILRDVFKDRTDPSGGNFGFGDQIPPITDVCFSDIPLDANEGLDSTKLGTLDGDAGVPFLLEIPDEAIEELKGRDGWHGKQNLTLDAVVRLADALGVELPQLLSQSQS